MKISKPHTLNCLTAIHLLSTGLANLLRALRTKWAPEFGARMLVREPRADVTDAQLLRVHTLAHTAKVELALSAAKGMQRVNLDSDTIATVPSGIVLGGRADHRVRRGSKPAEPQLPPWLTTGVTSLLTRE